MPLFPRLLETSCSERPWDSDALPPSLALSRSQEPICSEEASACISHSLIPPCSCRLCSLEPGPDHSLPAGSSFSPGHGVQPQFRCCSSCGPSGQTYPAAGAWRGASRCGEWPDEVPQLSGTSYTSSRPPSSRSWVGKDRLLRC